MLRAAVGAWSLGLGSVALADGPPSTTASPSPSAGRASLASGTWTIAVVTSSADPGSKGLLQALRSAPWVVANADRVKLAEVNSDASGRPSGGGSTAVLVYQQGARGPEMMGGRSGFAGSDDVVLWVRNLVANSAEGTTRDPNLTQANLFGKTLPSAQGEYASPQPQAQAQALAQPGTAYAQPSLPQPQTLTYALPMPANVIQAPQQHLVIQQPPTQVLFAPATAPMVYLPQLAQPQPAPNLYLTPPQALAPAPTMGMIPQQVPMTLGSPPVASFAAPAQAPVGLPAGPGLAGAALTTSSFSVPASSTTTRVRVKGPGPVASALSRFGERLTTLGRTRIESIQETRLETQATQTPPGQFMTLSSTSASPILNQAPAQTYQLPGPAPAPALPALPPASPQSPQASPQGGQGRWR